MQVLKGPQYPLRKLHCIPYTVSNIATNSTIMFELYIRKNPSSTTVFFELPSKTFQRANSGRARGSNRLKTPASQANAAQKKRQTETGRQESRRHESIGMRVQRSAVRRMNRKWNYHLHKHSNEMYARIDSFASIPWMRREWYKWSGENRSQRGHVVADTITKRLKTLPPRCVFESAKPKWKSNFNLHELWDVVSIRKWYENDFVFKSDHSAHESVPTYGRPSVFLLPEIVATLR